MIAGGMHFHGLSDIFLLGGTMNEFSYAQALLFYKENLEELKKIILFKKFFLNRIGQPLIRVLIKKTYKKFIWRKFDTKPPNSPDFAYQIETLWALLKKC